MVPPDADVPPPEGRGEEPPPAGLRVRGVGVDLAGRPFLRGVSLDLPPGGAVVLRGASGSGKSTLLRALVGLDPVAEGAVRLDGDAPEDLGWPRFRRAAVLVAQEPSLPGARVEASLQAPFTYAVAERDFPAREADALLERLGLRQGIRDAEPRTLSGGEARRVAVARALLVGPRVLLLDEPTAGLDDGAVTDLLELLSERRARDGLGVLCASHDARVEDWAEGALPLARWKVGEPPGASSAGPEEEA